MFGLLKAEERKRRRNVQLDRKHLEGRARRFLKIYLNADETRKPQFYEVLQKASEQCLPPQSALPSTDFEDSDIAKATSNAAMKVVLERSALNEGDIADFETDAYATICIAYAGGYSWRALLCNFAAVKRVRDYQRRRSNTKKPAGSRYRVRTRQN